MLHLRVLTTEKTVFDGAAVEVNLPTEAGMIGVLANHSPLITIIKPGQMKVKQETETTEYFISGGILEVRPESEVVILATAVELATDKQNQI